MQEKMSYHFSREGANPARELHRLSYCIGKTKERAKDHLNLGHLQLDLDALAFRVFQIW